MLELKNVSKYYYSKGVITTGFRKISLSFELGEFVAITGESGSGKSTLLNVISGLETYEEGEVLIEGKETSHYQEKDWENYRRKYIGNIYQNFNLINSYTVYQNIDLILSLNGVKKKERKQKTLDLLKKVDMMSYKNTKVSKLSGGQKQRVAIARALAKDVPVIIADEPTGSLDKKSAESIIKLLKELSKDKLIIIVTHNYEQVEDVATRKITMHDGRVIEDKKVREMEHIKIEETDSCKNMRFLDKLHIGLRNTFNVIPKFLLLLAVYSFVVAAIMGEYSFFKKAEYEESKEGENYIFTDTNDHRVVLNKKDHTSFTKEDFDDLKNMSNIDKIVENDILLENLYTFVSDNDEQWLNLYLHSIDELEDDTTLGRMPENDQEIVVSAPADYYLVNNIDQILDHTFYYFNDNNAQTEKNISYKVVGYVENNDTYYMEAYISNNLLNEFLRKTHMRYSTIEIDSPGNDALSESLSQYFHVETNDWVFPGTVFISEYESGACPKYNCIGQAVRIKVSNIKYQEEKTFTVAKTYTRENMGWIMNLPSYKEEDFDMLNGPIYLNPTDYNALFDKPSYQASIYVDDIKKIDETVNELQELGYDTLMIKDTLVDNYISRIIRVVKIIITIISVFVLFFISYFVIKIILKSRNIYFSIIRMLGSSKKTCLQLLMIELTIVANISYFIFLVLAILNKKHVFELSILSVVNEYFMIQDYLLLYIIIIAISLLISLRYARKLFKNSAMSTYREEV